MPDNARLRAEELDFCDGPVTARPLSAGPRGARFLVIDEAGEEIGTTTVPVMESYEVSPAVKAVKKKTETVVVRPETVVEKTPWKDTVE